MYTVWIVYRILQSDKIPLTKQVEESLVQEFIFGVLWGHQNFLKKRHQKREHWKTRAWAFLHIFIKQGNGWHRILEGFLRKLGLSACMCTFTLFIVQCLCNWRLHRYCCRVRCLPWSPLGRSRRVKHNAEHISCKQAHNALPCKWHLTYRFELFEIIHP